MQLPDSFPRPRRLVRLFPASLFSARLHRAGLLLAALAVPAAFIPPVSPALAALREETSPPALSSGKGGQGILTGRRVSEPYGAGISRGTAESVARAAARLGVLENGAGLLDDDLAARMGVVETRGSPQQADARMRALASAVYPVSMAVDPPIPPDPAHPAGQAARQGAAPVPAWEKGTATVTARILLSPRDPGAAVRRALQRPDNLELRLAALQRMEKAAAEGREILARSAAITRLPDAENPFAARAAAVGRELDALEVYLDALRDFDHTWQAPGETVALMERLTELDPQNPLLWLGLGETLLLTERPYEALDALRAAGRLPDAPARTLYLRGLAHLRLHLPANAVEDFNEALAQRPDKAAWWRARGAARLLSGEQDAMCPDFYRACALGDCEGLAEVRKRRFCLDADAAAPAAVPAAAQTRAPRAGM